MTARRIFVSISPKSPFWSLTGMPQSVRPEPIEAVAADWPVTPPARDPHDPNRLRIAKGNRFGPKRPSKHAVAAAHIETEGGGPRNGGRRPRYHVVDPVQRRVYRKGWELG
ncbi:hypothetical protein N658DRAFT_502035 [Parathielavia hyrcaniae]|uniref:Uncharacterized protein n=1 Tax=Parathielavia hyrcaniae TaxID=113614 RepID=A0AAN6PQD5_9PEZI|nr:hypothetical protein N658DRAFT_502035 [Parathielavia hyrcaniae]